MYTNFEIDGRANDFPRSSDGPWAPNIFACANMQHWCEPHFTSDTDSRWCGHANSPFAKCDMQPT